MATSTIENCAKSVERIQQFDADSLVRKEDLGQLSFALAVPYAKRLIALYSQISLDFIEDVPDQFLVQLQQHANSTYNTFKQISEFNALQQSPSDRENLIESLRAQYEPAFGALHPIISYLSSRQRDFGALERQARAAVQSAADSITELQGKLATSETEAQRILTEIRKTASEQGVSQQAIYFKDEAELHENEAKRWKEYTVYTSIGLGIFALLSIFIHKIPLISPNNAYETVQIGISKTLIFGTIGYMLILCAKNFLSHKHNQIINKHRQNALLTFNALVDATKDENKRDIILQSAAACIFSPQETGYTKQGNGNDNSSIKLIEVAPKVSGSSAGH